MSNDKCCLFVHNFAYFSLFFKPVFSKIYLNKFKLHHLYMYLYLCVWINLYNIILIKLVFENLKFMIECEVDGLESVQLLLKIVLQSKWLVLNQENINFPDLKTR